MAVKKGESMQTVTARIPVWVRPDGVYITEAFDSQFDDDLSKFDCRPGGGERLVIVTVQLPVPELAQMAARGTAEMVE